MSKIFNKISKVVEIVEGIGYGYYHDKDFPIKEDRDGIKKAKKLLDEIEKLMKPRT